MISQGWTGKGDAEGQPLAEAVLAADSLKLQESLCEPEAWASPTVL